VSQVFPSASWAEALKQEVNGNALFRNHAADWKHGSVALLIGADPSAGVTRDMALLLELESGVCKNASYLESERARAQAAFVIEANVQLWREILQGTADFNKSLMQWKLNLTKGRLPTIIKYVPAFRELMASARRI
jgi:hypothetical protein